jgi:hypothetical protein
MEFRAAAFAKPEPSSFRYAVPSKTQIIGEGWERDRNSALTVSQPMSWRSWRLSKLFRNVPIFVFFLFFASYCCCC